MFNTTHMTNQTVSISTLLAFFLLPFCLLIAAQGWSWTFLAFCFLLVFLNLSKWHVSKSKKRTRFFLTYAIASLFWLLIVFEFEVVPFLEILFFENFFLICWISVACLFAHYTRKSYSLNVLVGEVKTDQLRNNAKSEFSRCEFCGFGQPPGYTHCRWCGFCISERDHHSLWLDVCIGLKNRFYFLGCLIALFVSCCYYANLTLTTICHPVMLANLFLVPNDCSDVFEEIHISVCFASALYALIIAFMTLLKILCHSWLICKNSKVYEMTTGQSNFHKKGNFNNCMGLWCSKC